jgi:hypothetical protein
MKVLFLGSTGLFGKISSELLAKEELITDIGCASRRAEAAQQAAEALGSKGHGVCVDITDIPELTTVASDYDIIINAAGPTSEVQLPALQAAIAAGIHYCDLGVSGKTAQRAMQLDAVARDQDVTAVISTGWFAVAGLLGVHAWQYLQQTENVSVGFQLDQSAGTPRYSEPCLAQYCASGRVDTCWDLLEIAAGPVPLYDKGHWIDVDPQYRPLHIFHPSGREITAYPVDLPYTHTLPRCLPRAKSITTLFSLNPPALSTLFVEKAQRIARGETDWAGATMDYLETAVRHKEHYYLTVPEGHPPGAWIWATASGVKDGRTVRYTCWPSMFVDWTSVPLIIIALRILRGDVSMHGVFTAEACFTLSSFLAEVAKYVPEEHRGEPLLNERIDPMLYE